MRNADGHIDDEDACAGGDVGHVGHVAHVGHVGDVMVAMVARIWQKGVRPSVGKYDPAASVLDDQIGMVAMMVRERFQKIVQVSSFDKKTCPTFCWNLSLRMIVARMV